MHIDTDLGGDPDDACALAMVLGWPDVEVTGITTVADPEGQRAGYVEHLLAMCGRSDIPVAAGAGRSTTTGAPMGEPAEADRYWGQWVAPRPGPLRSALRVLEDSIRSGALVVAIGPYTNLALLAAERVGALATVTAVAMGGWIGGMAAGFPDWGPDRDSNVQADTHAARVVAETAGDLTLVTLPSTVGVSLRLRDLPAVEATGPVGRLLARQSLAYRDDRGYVDLPARYPALPHDLVNFHWDPVACAVALGWSGATLEEMPLLPVLDGDVLRFDVAPTGRRTRAVVDVDADRFRAIWLEALGPLSG